MTVQIHGKEVFNNSDINNPDIDGGTIDNTPIGSTTPAASVFTQSNLSKGSDVASANALVLGSDGNYFDITGTTAITSIGTLGIGTVVILHFNGILTLTHNATDLILPGGANITTSAGDEATFVEYASGDWRCSVYTKTDGTAIVGSGDTKASAWLGAEDAYLPADNPALLVEVAGATSYGGWWYLAFDDTVSEHAIWRVPMPGYDGGNIVVTAFSKPETTVAAVPRTLYFDILTIGIANSEPFNSAVTVYNDHINQALYPTNLNTDISIESKTINPDNVAAGDLMVIEIARDTATDSLVDDGQLIGILLEYMRT